MPAKMPTVATTKTSGMPSWAIRLTASSPTNSMPAAAQAPIDHARRHARRDHLARTLARMALSSLALSPMNDSTPLSPARYAPYAPYALGSSAPQQSLSRQGHQHHYQPDLPPSLTIFDIARRVS